MKLPIEIATDVQVDLTKDVADVVSTKILASQNEADESFFVCDLGEVVKHYKLWHDFLPRMKPFCDVKCNNDPAVLTILAKLDIGFHCSTKDDMRMVRDLGVNASRIIYSGPCKLSSHIKYAANRGVNLIEFESESELRKIKSAHPNARLLLKVLPPDLLATNQSITFGCRLEKVSALFVAAQKLNLNVVGLSIQTRDCSLDPWAVSRLFTFARSAFDLASEAGFCLTVLDIGESIKKASLAGMPLKEACAIIRTALDEKFPSGSGVTILAEAARFFVESAFTLVTRVIDKTVTSSRFTKAQDGVTMATDRAVVATDPIIDYYLSDGIYRSFSGILYDGITVKPSLIDQERFVGVPRYSSRLLGPTRDDLDCVVDDCLLPELFVGDWILFRDMGAYALTGSAADLDCAVADQEMTTRPECHYTMRAKDWFHLCCCSSASQLDWSTVDSQLLLSDFLDI